MKKLENFLDKAPLWQVFIFGWMFTGIFTFLLFQFFPDGTELPRNWFVNLKIGFFMGIPFGPSFTWQTTLVTEIVEQREDYIKFNTENSVYELFVLSK